MSSFGGVDLDDLSDIPQDYGKWLIHGPQGSGKTTLASTVAEMGKTLFIDLPGEKGVRSFKGSPYGANLQIARPKSITAFDDIFWELNKGNHDFKAVVIDSITSLQKMAMRFLLGHDETAVREIRRGTAPAQIQHWGQSLDIMTDTATFWYGLADGLRDKPMHVVMTAQTKFTEDEDGSKIMRRVPDVQKGALQITLASPDYVLYTDTEDNFEALDDDSGTTPPETHIVRFGNASDYRIKARIPYHLRGKIPTILGRKTPVTLGTLSRILEIGGAPQAPAKKKAAAAAPTKK